MNPSRVCEEVLDLVGDRAEAEVTAGSGRGSLTRFANSHIHQNVADDSWWARLKVVVGGRQATASTNRVDRESLARLVSRTTEAAELRPVDPEWPGLGPAAPAPATDRYDADTALAPPSRRAEVVREFVAAGPGLLAAGYCDTIGREVAFANSAGQRLQDRYSRATLEAIHRTPTSDGRGWQTTASVADVDGAAVGRVAADKARSGEEPVDLEPGEYEVVLEPACVADMADFLSWYGFNAKAHGEGQSFVELGEQQLDPSISIWDDATDRRAIGLGFDAEGTPKRRIDLVRAGVSVGLAHDRRTARRAGTESTGHAIAGGESWGPLPGNLFLGAGDQPYDDLVASVERGLLVTDFWYTRVLDPKTQVVTGLTRNGTFMIEKGKVTRGVRNLRFTQSYVEALAPGRVLGVGDDARRFGAGTFVPSLHLAAWNFTGGATG